jgi:hypothetical protein
MGGARGFNAAEEGHVMMILPPIDKGGTSTYNSLYINMEGYQRCQIYLGIGVSAGTGTAILYESDDGSGSSVAAIACHVYKEETGSGDTLGERTAMASTGLTIANTSNIFYVIDITADELSEGYPYLNLRLTALDSTTITCGFAVLSGARYGTDQSPTAQ